MHTVDALTLKGWLAGLTGCCGLALLMAKAPWNRGAAVAPACRS